MPLFPKTSANLLLKEKNNQTTDDEPKLLSDEALEDDLEMEKDIDDLPI